MPNERLPDFRAYRTHILKVCQEDGARALYDTEREAGLMGWLWKPIAALIIGAGITASTPAWLSVSYWWLILLVLVVRLQMAASWKIYEESGHLAPDEKAKELLRELRAVHPRGLPLKAHKSPLSLAEIILLLGPEISRGGISLRGLVREIVAILPGFSVKPQFSGPLALDLLNRGLLELCKADGEGRCAPGSLSTVNFEEGVRFTDMGRRVFAQSLEAPDLYVHRTSLLTNVSGH